MKFYICETCGNIITHVNASGVPVFCCGKKMTELVPGTTDAAVEKLAIEATPDAINTMKMNDKATQERIAREKAEALEISKKLRAMTLVVKAKGGGAGRLFGAVTTQEIAAALEAQAKIKLDKRKLVLAENIKNVGTYTVTCRLGYEITAPLTVKIEEA